MNILDKLLYGIFPKTCPICDKTINSNEFICESCSSRIILVKEPKCKKCGKPLIEAENEYCEDCSKNNHLYTSGVSAFVYSNEIKQSIYKFKYHNRRDYAGFYARAICKNNLWEIKKWQAEVIIPVPIHPKRRLLRGYNQTEILSRELSKYLGIPVNNNILIRSINTKPQKELTVKSRRENLENAFKITENVVKYKKVVLVDDIYTTGSTIDACAKVLLEHDVKTIYFISLSIGAGI